MVLRMILAQTTTPSPDASLLFLPLMIGVALGLIVGAIARSKGRSFAAWWLFGTFFFLIALIVVLILPRKTPTYGASSWTPAVPPPPPQMPPPPDMPAG
jgi:cell division protein FtsW (lipid II flippase)